MSNKRATITLADGTKVTLDNYAVDDVRWLMKTVSANTASQHAQPQPEPNPLAASHRVPAGATRVRLPTMREGDHIEPSQNSKQYFVVDMGNGRHKKVPYQVKGLFQCAFCDAVLTTPASRAGHERAHIKRGEAPKRQIIEMKLAVEDSAERLPESKSGV